MKDNSFIQQCLDILKREDIQKECKILLKPFKDFILYEIQPYVYITIILVFLIFIMILVILVLLILIIVSNNNISFGKFYLFRKE